MRVNVTMLIHDRPELTRQSIASLYAHTPLEAFDLTLYDDASQPETSTIVGWAVETFGAYAVRSDALHGTGTARNQVIRAAEAVRGRGDYLYLSDNDVYFKPHWLETLVECFLYAESHRFAVLGAYNHPFNPPFRKLPFYDSRHRRADIGECHAVAMQSWLLRWGTWDRYGEFSTTPPGRVRQSEDHEWCQRLRKDGYKVGTVVPPLVLNTGRTDSFGEPVPGAELIPDIEGVIVQ